MHVDEWCDIGVSVKGRTETAERLVVAARAATPPFLKACEGRMAEAAAVHGERGQDARGSTIAVLEGVDGSGRHVDPGRGEHGVPVGVPDRGAHLVNQLRNVFVLRRLEDDLARAVAADPCRSCA